MILVAIRDSNLEHGPQIFGELLGIRVLWNPDDECASAELDRIVKAGSTPSSAVNDSLIGLAFAAGHLWNRPEYRDRATSILVGLMPQAEEHLSYAIMHVFAAAESLSQDRHTHRLLEAIVGHQERLLRVAPCEYVVELLADLLPYEAALVYELSRLIIAARGPEMLSLRYAMAMSAGHLVNIALTLQRLAAR